MHHQVCCSRAHTYCADCSIAYTATTPNRIREEALSTFSDHVLAVRSMLSRAWDEMSRQAEPSVVSVSFAVTRPRSRHYSPLIRLPFLLQPLSIQLDAFTLLSKSRTGSIQHATLAAESAYEACRACQAAHAGLEQELEDLAVEASLLQDAMRKRIHFVENQVREPCPIERGKLYKLIVGHSYRWSPGKPKPLPQSSSKSSRPLSALSTRWGTTASTSIS